MSVVIFIVCIIYFFYCVGKNKSTNNNSNYNHSTNSATISNSNGNTYRPAANKQKNSKIIFKTAEFTKQTTDKQHVSNELDLNGLHDAFTGAPLDENLGLHQCQACKVYYHSESFTILQKENSAKCVACQTAKIIEVIVDKKSTGKDYTPIIVTLKNYKNHLSSVVNFAGHVCSVKRSSSNRGVALMFENKPWCKGFKLVFLGKKSVNAVGGMEYITNLVGKTVKVRGLIVKHGIFGYQIIISEKSMVLAVS